MDSPRDNVNRTDKGQTDTRIVVDDLTFAYLRDPVLQGVSFTLQKNAIGLLGPNGSGKTTLLRALLGHLRVPPGTQPGKKLRLKGKGVKKMRGGGRGDHIIEIHVEIPESLDDLQKEAFLKFAEGAKLSH